MGVTVLSRESQVYVLPSPDTPVLQASQSENVLISVTEESPAQVIAAGLRGEAGPQGDQGPPGPPGSNVIGGHEVQVAGLKNGDLLVFSGSVWANENKVKLTDGGNF